MKTLTHPANPGRLVAVALVLLAACCSRLPAAAPNAPTNLRTYDKTNPIGTEARPYFGWYVNDPDDDEIQSGYQVLVASSRTLLAGGTGDLWDSGKVASGRQNHIEYAGEPLAAGTRYYWQVRTWDKDGNAGPYSKVATFDVGLLTAADWAGAKWVRRQTNDADDYTYYRKRFTPADGAVTRAIVYVGASHEYALYLNGALVGKGASFHYPQYQYYNAYDVTSAVRAGRENVFACLTHWYGGGQGRAPGSRGFLLKAVIEYADGTSTIVCTDATWKQTRVQAWATTQERRNGEGVGFIDHIDARKIIDNWYAVDYDETAWTEALEIGAPPVTPWTGRLQADLTRLIETEISPVSITDLGEGTYVIDLGKVYSGMPKITFSGGTAGAEVDIRGGYTLNGDGTVSADTDQNTDMSYFFTLDGGTATFEPTVYLGMRYIQVDDSPCPLTADNVSFIFRHYELDPTRSQFTSSNEMLNRVWDLMAHSIVIGAQEVFVDTPTREKGGFLGDSWLQDVPAMTAMSARAITLRVLLEFLDSQDQYWPDGRLNAVYPNVDGRRDIPDYTQSYLVWVWDYYLHTGNEQFLRDNYSKLKKVADYVDSYTDAETGLIRNLAGGSGQYRYGIIDWPAPMRYGYDMGVESRTVIDAYAYIDFEIVARIAEVLGLDSDRDTYRAKAQAMAEGINASLINSAGVYIDGLDGDGLRSPHVSQQANTFPLALGIVPEANVEAVTNAVKDRKMSSGMLTVRWLVEALGRADQGPHLVELYTNPEWDGWAKTLALGGTATWESWDALTSGQSMSHPWGAAGLLGIAEYVLGIKPLLPQHEKIQVRPLGFEDALTSAAGTLPTDRGDVSVAWSREGTRYRLRLTTPDNVTAKVYVPKCGTIGPLVTVDGVEIMGTEEGNYVYVDNIGSGTHTFERMALPY